MSFYVYRMLTNKILIQVISPCECEYAMLDVNLKTGRQSLIVALYLNIGMSTACGSVRRPGACALRYQGGSLALLWRGVHTPAAFQLRKNSSEKHFHTCTHTHTLATSEPVFTK